MEIQSNNKNNTIPWVEKYRPKNINEIVLDDYNRSIIECMLANNHFPNILLYGPPGTGKTTTIISIVNSFQKKNNELNKGLMIHLNASDDRGIDIIRNQIQQFVNSNSLFNNNGIKFVILDEVDYMTKNAQQALKYLVQTFNDNVRFCLICNYISRIDESLQNEFMRLRFNKLPENDIIHFLSTIIKKENVNIEKTKLQSIQELFKSDVRSMINYIQSNQDIINEKSVVDKNVWNDLTNIIINDKTYLSAIDKIYSISFNYNIEIKNLIKNYLNYIIYNKQNYVNNLLLSFTEFIMHLHDPSTSYLVKYTVLKLHYILSAAH